MARTKTTEQHERDIADESVEPLERIRAMQAVTFDRRYEYEPLLRRFVEHPHYIIRGEAIRRLLYIWDRADLLDRAIEMALDDPSEYARGQALGALQLFGSAHRDDEALVRRIVSVFVSSLRQEPEIDLQMGAHRGILLLLDGNQDYAPNHFDRETDVDWERLREIEAGRSALPPPPKKRARTTAKHERDIADESADPKDRADAILAITLDARYEYEPLVRALIDHPDPRVRGQAIVRLLHTWNRKDLLDRGIELALSDPDPYVRTVALSGITWIARHVVTDDEGVKRRIVATLARALREEPDVGTQRSTHGNILGILDGLDEYSPNPFDRDTDVDWERLREFEDGGS